MKACLLAPRRVAKPWGQRVLGLGQADPAGDEPPVGEVWFEAPGAEDPELLLKLLYTAQALSIQVHPGDALARARGHRRGKDEAWLILHAEPGARVALGPREPLTRQALRAAVEEGSVAGLLAWRPVAAGDFLAVPAGTLHAIGAGITLVEVQQNADLTYRLHDEGRGRELHIDEGVAASTLQPWAPGPAPMAAADGRCVLHEGATFVQELWRADVDTARHIEGSARTWVLCLQGTAEAGTLPLAAGQCAWIEGPGPLLQRAGSLLVMARPAR